ncbi:MAG: serpin family protein [Caldisericaceae bacterium]|nr:serpin family protein [Caldisericaceae bacterium]
MKQTLLKLIFLILAMHFVLACSRDHNPLSATPSKYQTLPVTHLQKNVIQANNDFSFDLFTQVNQLNAGKNVFISPFSVSMALGMTLNGADGETYTAMQKTLGFTGMDAQQINDTYHYLYNSLQDLDPKVIFKIANSIWCRQGIDFLPDFLKINQTYFHAEVQTLNFADPQAVLTINNWIARATNQKIKKVLEQIPSEAVMYLINALYFNGLWTYQFPQKKVRQEDFSLLNGQLVQCQMMRVQCKIPILIEEDLQAVQLPYGQGNFAMTVIMPSRTEFESYQQSFNLAEWQRIQENFKQRECVVGLPKFRFDFKSNLNQVLSALGMGIAFNENRADFSRISETERLFINRVIHQTFVEVSEKGTEAAAVTVVEIGATSVGPTVPTIIFNQPFIFVISETSTNTILFMGSILQPEWQE